MSAPKEMHAAQDKEHVQYDGVVEPLDVVALGRCLRSCSTEPQERQAFLQAFEQADNRLRYHMLLHERQTLLHNIHEKEKALSQLDYMLHLLNQQLA